MAWYVHLSVTMNLNSNELDKISDLAERHIADLLIKNILERKEDEEGSYYSYDQNYVGRFLEAVKNKKNYNEGGKGELFTWGIIGNYTRGDVFCRELEPFFKDMLLNEVGICKHNHILVFEEGEQSHNAIAYEIYLDKENGQELVVNYHKCPFKWNQG